MDTAPDLWEVVWTVDGYDGERRAGPYSLSVAQEHQADIGGYEGCHAWIVPADRAKDANEQ